MAREGSPKVRPNETAANIHQWKEGLKNLVDATCIRSFSLRKDVIRTM